jgi:hypothetical protein
MSDSGTTNIRADKIDAAVMAALELISALHECGPLTPGQIRLLLEASARSAVRNFKSFELKNSARRIYEDFKGATHDQPLRDATKDSGACRLRHQRANEILVSTKGG